MKAQNDGDSCILRCTAVMAGKPCRARLAESRALALALETPVAPADRKALQQLKSLRAPKSAGAARSKQAAQETSEPSEMDFESAPAAGRIAQQSAAPATVDTEPAKETAPPVQAPTVAMLSSMMAQMMQAMGIITGQIGQLSAKVAAPRPTLSQGLTPGQGASWARIASLPGPVASDHWLRPTGDVTGP